MKGLPMTLKTGALALGVALLSVLPVAAQTALTTTTLSTAITTPSTTTPAPAAPVALASTTGLTAGSSWIFIDAELMQVRSVPSSTTLTVQRGAGSTVPTPHAVNTLVYLLPSAQAFTTVDYTAGSCVPSAQRYLPVVNIRNGNIWNCVPTFQTGQAATTANAWRWAAYNPVPIMEAKPRTVTTGAAYTILPTDYIVALITNGAVGTAVTVKSYTLPVPSTVLGKMVIISDEAGIISATTSIVLVGTINGTSSLNATVVQMKTAFQNVGLYAGSDSWFILWCTQGGIGTVIGVQAACR